MDRRAFIDVLGGLLAAPLCAQAQPAKVWRIGMLDSSASGASVAFDQALRTMAKEGDQAVLAWGNPHLTLHRPQIAELALRTRMPVLYDVRYPDAPRDELMLYGPVIPEVWREAATYVDRIFRGAKPGDLPIGQARVFELVINLRVAKAIGLVIPKSVLMRADEVIE